MKKLALAVSILGNGLVVGVGSALAADLPAHVYTKAPAVAVYDWSGIYVGVNGGYASASKCWDMTSLGGVPLAGVAPEGCHDAKGGIVGGQVGYRWQVGSLVAGLEGQGNWADLRGSNLSLLGAAVTNQSKIDAFGLFSGQFGYAWNNTLFYVKSGLAVTDDKYQGIATATGIAFDSAKETRVGYSAGVGIEYGFSSNWSAALEYDHFFMFDSDVPFNAIGTGVASRIDTIHQDVDLVTVRVNYRWGGPVVAKY